MTNRPGPDLRGLWVPLITPFAAAGALDERSIRSLGRRVLDDGVAGLVALGTTGEAATLSPDERDRVLELCGEISTTAGRPLLAGAGTNSTAATIAEIDRLTRVAPVAAALVVVPYYTRPSVAAVVEHFQIVADESPVPVVVYNIPYRTGRGLDADALVELGGHPGIIGLKQAVGSLDHDTLEVLARRPAGFEVLAGDDAFIAPTVLAGGGGGITAAAHLCTSSFVALVEAALKDDVVETRRLAARLLPVVRAGFAEPNPAVWKGVLHRRGEISSPTLRRPLTTASDQAVRAAAAAAARAGTGAGAGAGAEVVGCS